jgi:hypothetical protein
MTIPSLVLLEMSVDDMQRNQSDLLPTCGVEIWA